MTTRTCAHCGLAIFGEITLADGKFFHRDCFDRAQGRSRMPDSTRHIFEKVRDDLYSEPEERPYCDECGNTLVDGTGCGGHGCKRKHLHCPNTNCGASPHVGEDWL